MYESYFGLQHSPFLLTPDTERFVDLPGHKACMALLEYALEANEGFIKVTGDIGTGKTLLCRMFLKHLQNDNSKQHHRVVYIPNPLLSALGLLRTVASNLGIRNTDELAQADLFAAVQNRIVALGRTGRTTVILIDEAQSLPPDTLEALRLMSNVESETRKLVQIFLFGQVELDALLNEFRFRQVKQRIANQYHLPSLDRGNTQRYLNQRIQLAGREGEPLFSTALARELSELSGGVPRLINILAHKTLLSAYSEGHTRPTMKDLEQARRDTELPKLQRHQRWLLSATGSIMLAAALGMAWLNGLVG